MLWSLTLPLLLGAAQETPTWKAFTSKEGGFAVSLPTSPTEERRRVQTATGQLEVTLLLAEDKNNASSYVVSYSDLPEADAKKGTEQRRLDYARDGAVAKSRGKLRSEQPAALGSNPGRDLVIDTESGAVVRLRLLVVGRRLYQLMAVGPGNVVLKGDGTFFLDSFHLAK